MTTDSFFFFCIIAFCWLALWAGMSLMPYYTRKTIAFGVAVPPEQNREPFLTGLRKHYLVTTSLMALVLAAASLFSIMHQSEATSAIVGVATMLLYTALSFVVYARANRVVKAYKRDSDWVIRQQSAALIVDRDDKRKLFSPWWYLTQVGIVVATAAYSLSIYDSLPAKLPMQTGIDGSVTTWAAKSTWTLLQMPLIMLAMVALFAGIGIMINTTKRQTDDANTLRGLYNNRSFQIIMGKTMFWMALVMQAIFVVSQLSIMTLVSTAAVMWATIASLVLIAVMVIYVTIKVGQGGYALSKAEKDFSPSDASVTDDDAHWVFFGTFYNNPNDPTLFPEKRVGVGWALNIGLPAGKAILIVTAVLLIGLIVAIPFLPTN